MNLKSARPIYHTYQGFPTIEAFVRQLFEDFKFDAPYEDFDRDIELVSHSVRQNLFSKYKPAKEARLEVLRSVFPVGLDIF